MCWSAKTSLTSFILGYCICSILLIRNRPYDRFWGLFFMFVITMQLLEFLIWLDQPKKGTSDCSTGKYRGKLNNVASQIAVYQNLLQPVALMILIIIFYQKEKLLVSKTVLIVSMTIYMIILLIWTCKKTMFKKILCTIPCQKSCNTHHLQWQWLRPSIAGWIIWTFYFVMLIVGLLSITKTISGAGLGVFLLLSLLIASFVYPFKRAAGSWWCVMAVVGPLVKIVLIK